MIAIIRTTHFKTTSFGYFSYYTCSALFYLNYIYEYIYILIYQPLRSGRI